MKIHTLALISGVVLFAGLAEGQTRRTIRINFGYTRGVRNSVGGTSNTRSLLNTKLSSLQTVHSNGRSNTGITFSRPAHFEVGNNNQNQTANTQLSRLNGGNQFSDMRANRNRTSSDLVQMYCDWTNGGVLGIAQLPGFANLCRRNVLTINGGTTAARLTHAHEVGHNLNAPHSHGFCLSNGQRTVMEPNNGSCSRGRRIFYHSSATRSIGNTRLGNNSNQNRERIISRAGATSRLR